MAAFPSSSSRTGSRSSRSRSSSSRIKLRNSYQAALTLVAVVSAFYGGLIIGLHAGGANNDCSSQQQQHIRRANIVKDPLFESMVQQRVKEAMARQQSSPIQASNLKSTIQEQKHGNHNNGQPTTTTPRFGVEMSRFALGAIKTNKADFLDLYDYGYPEDEVDDPGQREVLILYDKKSSLPNNPGMAEAAMLETGVGLPKLPAADATANCDALHVVSTGPLSLPGVPDVGQCLAIVGQYPSFNVQTWMRISPKGGEPIRSDLPLVPVGRGMQPNGVNQFIAPADRLISRGWNWLQTYLANVQSYKQQLRLILERLLLAEKKNHNNNNAAVIVMVCNLGQVDLLMNFNCAAKAKGLDISNVLVFAVDEDAKNVAEALGMTVFYHQEMFKGVNNLEAKIYGDKTFRDMMVAKVEVVQLVNSMGYDVLFQDVDVVWYKNPLPLFQDKQSPLAEYDMIFQDDGARSIRYAPHSANSGFYYVRVNAKTKFLLSSLLRSVDNIWKTGSHQQALSALLSEHSSLFNLRVKTMRGDDFPSGFHYHRAPDLMHRIARGEHEPFLFHMSWTDNKDNKLRYLKQMGLWYVKPECEGQGATEVLLQGASTYESSCCAAEPLVSCHFRDKPSIIPCNESPPADVGRPSFWG